jgi:cellulose biosynthesis protein BcsQ
MIYAIWNNKGGVGKTFLTFMMAGEYAQDNPSKNVVIIDLCPQANLSEIVLGGNGKGSAILDGLLNRKPKRQTIGGYFDERILSPYKPTNNEATYIINPVSENYNPNIPKNLYLVAGDPSLELQAQVINQISILPQPEDAWKCVHSWVIDLIEAIKKTLGEDTMFFIDCNPSFASYTELAILAAERLMVPCSADGSSARAIDNMGRLIYGVNVPSQYQKANFFSNAKAWNFKLPEVHLVSLNRSTQYGSKASKGFSAMFDEIKRRTTALAATKLVPFSANKNLYVDIPDSHTLSIICSHHGLPISALKPGIVYNVHGKNTVVPRASYNTYINAIHDLISRL